MALTLRTFLLSVVFLFVTSQNILKAQDKISWLEEFTPQMTIGSDTYEYRFSTVDGNECKLKIEELLTDKKGSTESRYWIFYLSDLDPAAMSFKPSGKSVALILQTRKSQKFISYYEEGEFDEYTDEIELTMNEVDLSRNFIDAMKENSAGCAESQAAWSSREEAFDWLIANIGKATDDDIRWEQKFLRGEKDYLAKAEMESTDGDGVVESFSYLFNLNDINPLAVNMVVSGRTLSIEVPVRESKKLIEMNGPDGKEYVDEMLIHADDIEVARQIINSLSYLVSNTTVERPSWENYSSALEFISANLGEFSIEDEKVKNELSFDPFPDGKVTITVTETDAAGVEEIRTYIFYPHDIVDVLNLDVSKTTVAINIETKNDRDFIRLESGESAEGYASTMELKVANVDLARDIIKAFEFAIEQSIEQIDEFASVSEVKSWFGDFIAELYGDGAKYEQEMLLDESNENQLSFKLKVTEEDGEVILDEYILYPEDISLDKLEIVVKAKKMNVPLVTGKDDFIKHFQNGILQKFEDEFQVYFVDPLVAKNFMAAIRFLGENSKVENREEMSKEEAISFINANIMDIELTDEKFEQSVEVLEEGTCKFRFTRVETDDKGERDEFIYEFMVSDIHPRTSQLEISGELVEVHLITRGNEDLIKPYENGEAGNFQDEFTILVDDVLTAKKTLAAFAALSEACR